MAHWPAELLDDLTDLLDEIRSWTGVIEKKPGVFYVRREPFLHFHLVEGERRRADVKGRAGWVQLDLPRPASAARRQILRRELRIRYREKGAAPGSGRQREPGRASPTPRGSSS